MMNISACIITRNEETNLPRCLASLKDVVDEIVIVDSGSTDRTPFIATDFSARFLRHDWDGYVGQKNFAISKATHSWILSMDADEELSPQLRQSILEVKKSDPDEINGYSMSRVVFFENQWVRFGDWYPDELVRLFRKDKGRFTGGKVHERLEIEGSTQKLDGELHHYSFKDRADLKKRGALYARLWAETAHEQRKTCGPLAPLLHSIGRFLRNYFLKGGCKGGGLGFFIARSSAAEVYLKYTLLRHLSAEK